MNDLLDRAVAAHGGLDRFNQFKTVSASLVTGGALLLLKGQAGFLNTHVTVDLHQERRRARLSSRRFRWSYPGNPVGCSGPLLLLWLCHVDLSDRPLLFDLGRVRGQRDRALAGAERDLAASEGDVPTVRRFAQHRTNLLFRCRWSVAQTRL